MGEQATVPEAGAALPPTKWGDPSWTWEHYLQAATRLAKRGAGGPSQGSTDLPEWKFHWWTFVYANKVVGCWIALDEAAPENGCMHVVAGSNREGPVVHFQRRDWQICDEHPAAGYLEYHSTFYTGCPSVAYVLSRDVLANAGQRAVFVRASEVLVARAATAA